jgi:hypothetical protein
VALRIAASGGRHTKPLLVLVDELTTSSADMLTAIFRTTTAARFWECGPMGR